MFSWLDQEKKLNNPWACKEKYRLGIVNSTTACDKVWVLQPGFTVMQWVCSHNNGNISEHCCFVGKRNENPCRSKHYMRSKRNKDYLFCVSKHI